MSNGDDVAVALSEDERNEANRELIQRLNRIIKDGRDSHNELRKKVSSSYWAITILSAITFAAGLVLLSVPIASAYGADIDTTKALIAAGFGIADLATLFLFKPTERLHQLMADMGQITLALNGYHTFVGLQLLQMNVTSRASISHTADKIASAGRSSIRTIQQYIETEAA